MLLQHIATSSVRACMYLMQCIILQKYILPSTIMDTTTIPSANVLGMATGNHNPIILPSLPTALFPTKNLDVDKCKIASNLVALAPNDQEIALLGRSNVGCVDVDRDTALGETVRRGGSDDNASDPIDDGRGCGTVKDVFAVHEGFGDGYVGFDESW